jgi:hypothetical protein
MRTWIAIGLLLFALPLAAQYYEDDGEFDVRYVPTQPEVVDAILELAAS